MSMEYSSKTFCLPDRTFRIVFTIMKMKMKMEKKANPIIRGPTAYRVRNGNVRG